MREVVWQVKCSRFNFWNFFFVHVEIYRAVFSCKQALLENKREIRDHRSTYGISLLVITCILHLCSFEKYYLRTVYMCIFAVFLYKYLYHNALSQRLYAVVYLFWLIKIVVIERERENILIIVTWKNLITCSLEMHLFGSILFRISCLSLSLSSR